MPVSARLRHQPSTSTPFDGSQHQAMNGTLATDSPYTSLGFQESRRRRQIKSSTRLSRGLSGRSNTSSPFQATDLNIARPTMHGSPARPRTGSYTSSEDANGASSLTKTGRPSKALKGKPVHKCPVCEKIYTRNEHLRRHQLSHTIESLQCNIPGCGKQFRRTDVLARHREEHEAGLVRVSPPRHSENDPAATRVRKRKSPSSSSPAINIQHAGPVTTAAAAYSNSPAAGILPSDAEANGHHTHSDPSYHHARATGQFWDATSSQSSPGVFGPASHEIFNMGPTYTPFESHMATNNFALPPSHSADEWSRPVVSRSPRSATSSIPCAWPLAQDKHLRNSFSPTDSNQSGYTSFSTPGIEPTVTNMASNMTFFEDQDACEEAVILHDVTNMTRTQPGMEGQAKLEQLEGQYLDAFWTRFNTMFSVMHRHTFDAYGTSPLVRALMIAIGAQFFEDEAAQTMARTLRDACSKLLQRRPSLNYPCSRLWDLQAIFLHEAFSVYCSRRPSSRFSQGFEDLLTGLLSDHDNLFYSNPLATLADPATGTTPSLDSESPRIQWVHLESKRRLLLASYVLEIQQNAFFGSHRPVSDKNLPLPCSSALWEAYALDDWQALVFKEPNDCHSLTDFLAVADTDTRGTSAQQQQQHSDPFMFNIATAHNAHSAAPLPAFRPTDPSLTTSTKTRQCHFSTQAAQLALSTPIHDLLAVAGDTFVLGQKLATREQFEQAGVELRAWRASVGAEEAVGFAKGVLEIVLEEGPGGARGRVGLLAEDWVVSLAALVLWAVFVWPQQQQQQNQQEAADTSRMSLTGNAQESQHRARMAIQSPRMDSTGAKDCMVYAHSRVQGRLGWLAQDAAGMLRKLIGTAS